MRYSSPNFSCCNNPLPVVVLECSVAAQTQVVMLVSCCCCCCCCVVVVVVVVGVAAADLQLVVVGVACHRTRSSPAGHGLVREPSAWGCLVLVAVVGVAVVAGVAGQRVADNPVKTG